MGADELLPRGRLPPLRCWWESMALEDIPHSLVADGVAQIGQGADDPVIAPGTILLGHADDQGLELRVGRGATGRLALLRAVKFLGYEFAVPAKNCVGLDERRHLLEGFLA